MNKFFSFVDNDKVFYPILFLIFLLSLWLRSFLTIIILLMFLYIKFFRDSITKVNTVVKLILWLIYEPIIIALFPFAIIEYFIPTALINNYIFVPLYLIFFVLSWVLAVFIFDINKIKLAIQIVNAFFLSVLSLTFISYFTSDVLRNLFSMELISELKRANIGIETFFDLLIKTITIPYVLSGLWANVAIAYREYKNLKNN